MEYFKKIFKANFTSLKFRKYMHEINTLGKSICHVAMKFCVLVIKSSM